jgi:hypothetical protein
MDYIRAKNNVFIIGTATKELNVHSAIQEPGKKMKHLYCI